jgi:hypothetical protein
LRQRTLVIRLPVGSPVCSLQTYSYFNLELTPADIAAIDSAGERGVRREAFIKTVRGMAELMLLGAVIFRIYAFLAKT